MIHRELAMNSLRILLAARDLDERNGGSLYVRDLALGLFRAGHAPIVFAQFLGEVAEELTRATIPVAGDLRHVGIVPDVIHGQNIKPSLAALLQFPHTPGLFVCHGWWGEPGTLPHFPRLLRYVAVDETVRDRLLAREGLAEPQVELILNSVDLDRFRPRPPLPVKPRRALVFSNYAGEHTHLPVIREACTRLNLPLDVVGGASGRVCERPEELLGRYDLAFAKGRCALEALAVGTAVVLCDFSGAGSMVTFQELERLRRLNFGCRAMQQPWSADWLTRQIERYDRDDARRTHERIRTVAGLERAVAAHARLCEEVVALHKNRQAVPVEAEFRALAQHLQRGGAGGGRNAELGELRATNARLRAECDDLRRLANAQRRRYARRPLLASLGVQLARWARG